MTTINHKYKYMLIFTNKLFNKFFIQNIYHQNTGSTNKIKYVGQRNKITSKVSNK